MLNPNSKNSVSIAKGSQPHQVKDKASLPKLKDQIQVPKHCLFMGISMLFLRSGIGSTILSLGKSTTAWFGDAAQ